MLFGSELFEEYIGQLAMASMASLDIFTEGENFDAKKLQEKMRVCLDLAYALIVQSFLRGICLEDILHLNYFNILSNVH